MMQLDTCHWKARVVGVASNMERLHMAVFMVRNQKDKINTSCLAHQTALSSCSSLHTAFEHLAQCPAYLRHAVWLLARLGNVLDLTLQLPWTGAAIIPHPYKARFCQYFFSNYGDLLKSSQDDLKVEDLHAKVREALHDLLPMLTLTIWRISSIEPLCPPNPPFCFLSS